MRRFERMSSIARTRLFPVLAVILSVVVKFPIQGNVASWRNGGTGVFPRAGPPVEWNSEDSQVWATSLGGSNGSPILVDGKLFCNEEPNALVCVDSETGIVLWKRENGLLNLLGLSDEEIEAARATVQESERLDVEIRRNLYQIRRIERNRENISEEEFEKRYRALWERYFELGEKKESLSKNDPYGETVMPAMHPTNGYTTYTPVSDGELVFACYGFGAVVAYDFEGNRRWHRVLDDSDHVHGGTVSPVLAGGQLVVRFSDYVALDPKTGEELWRAPSEVTFGTSAPFELEGESFLFTPRGEVIRMSDGAKLTQSLVQITGKDSAHTTFSSPVLAGRSLFTVRGEGGLEGHAYHFRIPRSIAALEENGLELVWRKDVRKQRYYASPVASDGLLYLFTEAKWLIVLEVDSGELVYEKRIEGLRGPSYSSLALAGNRLFAGSEVGQVVAFEAGREYKEIGRSEVGPFLSSPIFDADTVYLRASDGIRAYR